MTEPQYAAFAQTAATVDICGQMGQMDLETSSLGRTYVLSDIRKYTYDGSRLTSMVQAAVRGFSPAECNQTAMAILERKRRIAQHNAMVAKDEKALSDALNKPKSNAACHSNGVQVLCSSY